MKILYGVQATGNGHISRARQMQPELAKHGVEMDFLFSGRERKKLFDMEQFGNFEVRRGLTFSTKSGKIDVGSTLLHANFAQLSLDVQKIDLSGYDLILSDYEPVVAWAAKLQGKEAIGLGHQYAFRYPIPQVRGTLVDQMLLENFAPAEKFCGLHYHHFGYPILPPIIREIQASGDSSTEPFVLVYLPFERRSAITKALRSIRDFRFEVFHPECEKAYTKGNISWNPPSSSRFTEKLAESERVLCNAGFMLTSEVISLNKPLLVKPVAAQPEQQSNALAIDELGLGRTMQALNKRAIREWLEDSRPAKRVEFGAAGPMIAEWIANGCEDSVKKLSKRVWKAALS